MKEFTIKIKTTGDHTESELIDFLIFQLSSGSIDMDNPFVKEDSEAEIDDVELY